MPDTTRTAAEELAHQMRQLLGDLGISRSELARRLGSGFSQSKVSRHMSGVLVPTPMDAARYALQLTPDRDQRRRLVALARDVAEERAGLAPVRVALTRAPARGQRRYRDREADTEHVATFHPAIVPGLLQTADYVRAIFRSIPTPPTDPDAEDAFVRERLARQEARRDRPATQLVTEGALAWGVAGSDVMKAQCAHIAELTRTHPHWGIGVIPRIVPPTAPIDYPPNGFDLYDRDAVLIGTTAGNTLVTDPTVIRSHVERLDRLRGLALYGADARAALARIAQDYTRAESM